MALTYLAVSPLLFFSCTGDSRVVEQSQTAVPSPLEAVRLLAETNRQFETSPIKSNPSHPREIKEILDKGYIVFAMTASDQKPFFYKDEESGELIGIDVELGYAIANRLGVKAVFNRDATSFDGVVTKVVNKEADIALSKLSLTIRRAEIVRFTNPYITFRQALLINRLEFAKIGPEEQLPRYIRSFSGSLGVINNSSYMNYAFTNFPNADLKTFETWNHAVNALFDGNLLAIYRDEGEILIVNATIQDASILMKPVFISDQRDPIAMAVSADAPLLQEWLNVFLDNYLMQNRRELTPGRLIERHFRTES
jgi:ABC-type amino acid transport substrate-binding protein